MTTSTTPRSIVPPPFGIVTHRPCRSRILRTIGLLAGLLMSVAASDWAQTYTATNVGLDPVNNRLLSAAGWVAGPNMGGEVGGGSLLYSGGNTISLGQLPGTVWCAANSINNNGQVAGYCNPGNGYPNLRAFLYSAGNMIDLGSDPPSYSDSIAYGINNTGQVVGCSGCRTQYVTQAFLYGGGTMITLGTLPAPYDGPKVAAYGINDGGQVVGQSGNGTTLNHAFLYTGGAMFDLGSLYSTTSYSYSVAYSINNQGQVVGYSNLQSSAHAFLYSGGAMIDLGTCTGDPSSSSVAYGINNGGQVVGACSGPLYGDHAFLYSGRTMRDLNGLVTLPTGVYLVSAFGINDHGQISAIGSDYSTYLLTPSLEITTTSLPNATSGQPYPSTTLTATGSGRGYTWCVQSGSSCVQSGAPLPAGFTLSSAGVLSSTGTPAAPVCSYSFTVQVTDSAGNSGTQPLTLFVQANVTLTWSLLQPPMQASFTPGSAPSGLTAQAGACGFTGFDWVQQITQTGASPLVEADGTSIMIPPHAPINDPPQGGYLYADPNIAFIGAYPFVYNPAQVELGCAGYNKDGSCGLEITGGNIFDPPGGTVLNFYDSPLDPCFPGGKVFGMSQCTGNSPFIGLTTQLVGICGANSPPSLCSSPGRPSAALFQWTWKSDFNGASSGGVLKVLTASSYPPDPGSGTGGITVTNINGIQLPSAVSPSQVVTTASGPTYSPVNLTFDGTVTVTNNSGGPISGPLQILFTGLPASVTLVNASGNLSGTPYISVPGVLSLGAGQSVTVNVQFANPSNVAITFAAVIYSGSIITTFSRCDLEYTGSATVADVQLVVNQALGAAQSVSDLNGDGVLNVADVQIEISAALGLSCSGQ